MEEEKQTGFWQRFFVACFQPAKYKSIIERRTVSHVAYVSLLAAFLVILESVIPFMAWDISVGGIRDLIVNRLPEFSVTEKGMEIASPVQFVLGGTARVSMDADVDKYGQEDLDGAYTEEILVSGSNVVLKAAGRISEVKFADQKGIDLNNQSLARMIPLIRLAIGFFFLFSFVARIIEYLIAAAFFGILCRVGVRAEDGRAVRYKDVFLIALYARTLFALIESINICLGNLVNDMLLIFLSALVTISYIYKAQASLLRPDVR